MTDSTVAAFWVWGIPKGQPRIKGYRRGLHVAFYTPDTADDWKSSVALGASGYAPPSPRLDPVRVDLDFFLPRPKRLMGKRWSDGAIPCPVKPDLDNLAKGTLDILTQLGFWHDDAQIIAGTWTKWYAAKNGKPGCMVAIFAVQSGAETTTTKTRKGGKR